MKQNEIPKYGVRSLSKKPVYVQEEPQTVIPSSTSQSAFLQKKSPCIKIESLEPRKKTAPKYNLVANIEAIPEFKADKSQEPYWQKYNKLITCELFTNKLTGIKRKAETLTENPEKSKRAKLEESNLLTNKKEEVDFDDKSFIRPIEKGALLKMLSNDYPCTI